MRRHEDNGGGAPAGGQGFSASDGGQQLYDGASGPAMGS